MLVSFQILGKPEGGCYAGLLPDIREAQKVAVMLVYSEILGKPAVGCYAGLLPDIREPRRWLLCWYTLDIREARRWLLCWSTSRY